ncbi:MAG: cell division protein [Pseudomonadota bacterium]
MRWKAAEVPLNRDASERFLPWLMAFLIYLGALALAAAMAVHNAVGHWDSGLAGKLTVQVMPGAADENPAITAERVARVLEELRATQGVVQAHALDEEEIVDLLEPWLGGATESWNLPLPQVVAVELDRDRPPDLTALSARLGEVEPGTAIDDHQRWLGELLDLIRGLQILAIGVIALVALASIGAIVFITRTGMAIHRPVIDLLHLIGAQDSFVAWQFQLHALKQGLRGGVVALALTVLTLLSLGYLLQRADIAFLPAVSLSAWEWCVLALLPLLAASVAMITARITVLATLARMP